MTPKKSQLSKEKLNFLRDTIKNIIDEKLQDYILVPKNRYFIDEQGYKYVYTEDSFIPLKENFIKQLKAAQNEIENEKLIEHDEFWNKMGI